MLRVGQQLPLLGVRGLGQLCGMRVLGGPLDVLWGEGSLDVFLEIKA